MFIQYISASGRSYFFHFSFFIFSEFPLNRGKKGRKTENIYTLTVAVIFNFVIFSFCCCYSFNDNDRDLKFAPNILNDLALLMRDNIFEILRRFFGYFTAISNFGFIWITIFKLLKNSRYYDASLIITFSS